MKPFLLAAMLLMLLRTLAQPVERYGVLITEVMADPTPSVGLPAVEYIELKNVSGRPVDLDRWRISDASGSATIQGAQWLLPDSQLVVCARTQAAELQRFSRTVGVASFPSLDNEGETLVLSAPDGRTIHAIPYRKEWFGNPLKSEGGWSLEMVDPGLPCTGTGNWTASQSPMGGTPGRRNSVDARMSDRAPPGPMHAYSADSLTLVLCMDESVDSIVAAIPLRYRSLDGLGRVALARPLPPMFDRIALTLETPMREAVVYRLEVSGQLDCKGNTMVAPIVLRTGRSGPVRPGQLRINELLFDPKPEGSDHVELLNLGPGIIDASTLYLANRSGSGPTANLRKCSPYPKAILPGDHPTFTADSAATARQYRIQRPDMLFRMESLPPYPDDAGTVVVLDANGRECDAFPYRADYHFPLLADREGVALERIDPARPANDRSNWHSAGTDAGYATPTARNSQYAVGDTLLGWVGVSPATLSPDMDGFEDVLSVRYRFPNEGWTASVIIADAAGRPQRHLARNALCGTEGGFQWDGLDDGRNRLRTGIYYLVFEALDIRGRRRIWRKTVALAYRR
jgi:hypothetical protein